MYLHICTVCLSCVQDLLLTVCDESCIKHDLHFFYVESHIYFRVHIFHILKDMVFAVLYRSIPGVINDV